MNRRHPSPPAPSYEIKKNTSGTDFNRFGIEYLYFCLHLATQDSTPGSRALQGGPLSTPRAPLAATTEGSSSKGRISRILETSRSWEGWNSSPNLAGDCLLFQKNPPGPEILGAAGQRCSKTAADGPGCRCPRTDFPGIQFPGIQPLRPLHHPKASSPSFPPGIPSQLPRGDERIPPRPFPGVFLPFFLPSLCTSSLPADGLCFPGTFPFPNIRDFWPSPRCTACPSKPSSPHIPPAPPQDPCRAPPARMFWLGIFYGKQGRNGAQGGSWHLLSSSK